MDCRAVRFQDRRGLFAHLVCVFAVNGEGGSGSGEAAETPVRKPDLREPVVGDVRGRSAGDKRNAGSDADRSAHVGTLLLASGRNGLTATLGERAATVDAEVIQNGVLGTGFCTTYKQNSDILWKIAFGKSKILNMEESFTPLFKESPKRRTAAQGALISQSVPKQCFLGERLC
jgi:hypothetical protein